MMKVAVDCEVEDERESLLPTAERSRQQSPRTRSDSASSQEHIELKVGPAQKHTPSKPGYEERPVSLPRSDSACSLTAMRSYLSGRWRYGPVAGGEDDEDETDNSTVSASQEDVAPAGEVLRCLLGRYVPQFWGLVLSGSAAVVLHSCMTIWDTKLWAECMGAAITGDSAMVVPILKLYVPVALGSSASGALMTSLLETFNNRMARKLRGDLLENLLHQDRTFFTQRTSGSIASRISSDVSNLSAEITTIIRKILRSGANATLIIAYLFILNARLAAIVNVHLPFVLLMSYFFGKWIRRKQQKVNDAVSYANSVATERVSVVATIQAFATHAYEAAGYRSATGKHCKLSVEKCIGNELYQVVNRFMGLGSNIIFILQASALVVSGNMSASLYFKFLFYRDRLRGEMEELLDLPVVASRALGSGGKVTAYLKRIPCRPADGKLVLGPSELRGEICLDKVHFVYPTRPEVPIMRGCSLTAKAGCVTALVGASGGGKSTTISLIERYFEPTKGRVTLDGVDLASLDEPWLHSVIGLVAQEPVLFSGTVRHNIAYSMRNDVRASSGSLPENLLHSRVEDVAKAANAHTFVMEQLPRGYDTQVGERGTQLSGGQKQRIAIARALLQDPTVLLLDEATSALDSESESLVQAALDKAMAGRTVISVAHRLSTIAGADSICVFKSGVVVEQGAHADLMAREGEYAALVHMQTSFAA